MFTVGFELITTGPHSFGLSFSYTRSSRSPWRIKINIFGFFVRRASKSSKDPATNFLSHATHFHTGSGAPQNRVREIAQSGAVSSPFPKRPSFKCAGIQEI